MFEDAHNLWHCLNGSGEASIASILLFLLRWSNGFFYIFIAVKWWRDLRGGSTVQTCLVVIFLLCGLCGYWLPNGAAWNANVSYTAMLLLLAFLNVADVGFLIAVRGMKFRIDRKQIVKSIIEEAKKDDLDPSVLLAQLAKEVQEAHQMVNKL